VDGFQKGPCPTGGCGSYSALPAAFVGIFFGALAVWLVIGLSWDLVTWIRTGKGSDFFDHNNPFDVEKRDNG